MTARSQRWLWTAVVVLGALSFGWSRAPARVAADRLKAIPARGFGFVSRDLALNQTETLVYRRAAAVKRIYQTRTQSFLLTAIDGTRDRHAVHDPSYCFRGDGWRVADYQRIAVPGGQAALLKLARGDRQTEVVFWFTDGRQRQDSAWRAWWQSLRRRMSFGRAGLEPALVLLQPVNGQSPAWSSVFAQCPFLFEL